MTLADDLLQSTQLTQAELKTELALVPQLDFERLLACRQIPLHYGVEGNGTGFTTGEKATRRLIVVSDTSPILKLSAVGKLDLLRDLYSEIVVPPAVQGELCRNGIDPDALRMRFVVAQGRNDVAALRGQLDPGEAEAKAGNPIPKCQPILDDMICIAGFRIG